jgi:hypothetical protein
MVPGGVRAIEHVPGRLPLGRGAASGCQRAHLQLNILLELESSFGSAYGYETEEIAKAGQFPKGARMDT